VMLGIIDLDPQEMLEIRIVICATNLYLFKYGAFKLNF